MTDTFVEVRKCTAYTNHEHWCDCGQPTCWEEQLRLRVNFDKNQDREVAYLFIHRLLKWGIEHGKEQRSEELKEQSDLHLTELKRAFEHGKLEGPDNPTGPTAALKYGAREYERGKRDGRKEIEDARKGIPVRCEICGKICCYLRGKRNNYVDWEDGVIQYGESKNYSDMNGRPLFATYCKEHADYLPKIIP